MGQNKIGKSTKVLTRREILLTGRERNLTEKVRNLKQRGKQVIGDRERERNSVIES